MFNRKRAAARNNRYLLLLGAERLLRERAIVGALRAYPGMVVGFVPEPVVGANRYFDHVLREAHDPIAALEVVKELERAHGLTPEAVVPIQEMDVAVSVEIAEHYGCPRLSRACARDARDKHAMKVAFAEAGVPTARHALYSTLDELRQAVAKMRFPVVLKPRDFGGSVGTIKVDTAADIPRAFEHCRSGLEEVASRFKLAEGRFQVEEFVTSTHEVSVEVLNYGDRRMVLAVTDKLLGAWPYFAEIGQVMPGRDSDNEALKKLALRACEATHIDRGIAHVEVLIDAATGAMNVVEVAARPAGDGIIDLLDRVYGFNPYELHVATYLDTFESFPEMGPPAGTAGVAFLKARPGKIAEIKTPSHLAQEQIALYPMTKVGAVSRGDSVSFLAREGAAEFFWAGPIEDRREQMLALAKALAGEMFRVDP